MDLINKFKGEVDDNMYVRLLKDLNDEEILKGMKFIQFEEIFNNNLDKKNQIKE